MSNADIDGRFDSSRKLGNRNQYNPGSHSWKQYEAAYAFQEKINESLDSAVANGYELHDWNAEDIAIDVASYDAQFEVIGPAKLLPFVQEWKSGQAFLKFSEVK